MWKMQRCKRIREPRTPSILQRDKKKHVEIPTNMKYSDVFSHVDKQFEIVKIFKKIERQREILLNCTV